MPHPYNPAAGNLKFTYYLTQDCDITIKVFDAGARMVWQKECLRGTTGGQLGYNETLWDGQTAWGDEITNGVYLYLIIASDAGQKIIGRGKIVVLR